MSSGRFFEFLEVSVWGGTSSFISGQVDRIAGEEIIIPLPGLRITWQCPLKLRQLKYT